MRRFALILTAVLFFLTAGAAFAEKRIALVIGNGAYEATSILDNPPNDARLMERTLSNLGFEVVTAIDAGQKDIKRAVKRFGERLKAGGKDAIGLFYYAGHGVQVDGVNYLIPVDADIQDEGDVDIEAVSANSILSRMEHSGARLNFVVLDACRNNPFKSFSRSATRGLARMDAPAGSLVAYATSPGDVAADGDDRNSPYTAALARMMRRPGLTVEQMFRNVRNVVREKTGEAQTPWESSSLTGDDFFFAGDSQTAGQTADPDTMFWQAIQVSTNPVSFQAYLEAFPNGKFVPEATKRMAELGNEKVATLTSEPEQTSAPVPETPAGPEVTAEEEQVAVGLNFTPGTRFRDCEDCPEVTVIPAGSFKMGTNEGSSDEKPAHRVTFARAFAVGTYPVTVGQYARFIEEAGHYQGHRCWVKSGGEWENRIGTTWRAPGFNQTDNHPVVCVNWDDVQAYVKWLSLSTGQTYRLLSESEWEYVARSGSRTVYPCGDDPECVKSIAWFNGNVNRGTRPVGAKSKNAFGLYDLYGNVWEWGEDCWVENYVDAPTDGRAKLDGDCLKRIIRGGSWQSPIDRLMTSYRSWDDIGTRGVYSGFRVVRELSSDLQ